MTGRAQLMMVVLAVVGLMSVIVLVRRRVLKERYALMWLTIGTGMVGLVVIRPWLDELSSLLGIRSGTSTLFLFAILFLLGLILYQSVTISSLEEKVRALSEAVGLLRVDLESSSPPVDQPDDGEDQP